MKDLKKLSILFDYYELLLTEKQRNYFTDYYFNDLSLSEIAENYSVSRTAASKQINDVVAKLEYYESKLGLYKKRIEIIKVLDDIEDKEIVDKIINNI